MRGDQFRIPKFVRDNLTVDEEEIIAGIIEFAFERGRDLGYNEGYQDAYEDYATTRTADQQ